MDFYELVFWPGWAEGKFPPYWEELRRFVFRRDGYRCQRCNQHFWGKDLDAHHIIPKENGGSDSAANLITVCEPCHDFIHDALLPRPEPPDLPIEPETEPEGQPAAKVPDLVCLGQIAPGVLLHVRARRLPQGVDAVDPDVALAQGVKVGWVPDRLAPRMAIPRELPGKPTMKLPGPVTSWRTCRYFWRFPKAPAWAACRRFGAFFRGKEEGPTHRHDDEGWHYDRQAGDWTHKSYWRKRVWARTICADCRLYRPKGEG